MNNFKALTPESENVGDMKNVVPKEFNQFASLNNHSDFYCMKHFKDRIKNYCENYSLLDVLLSGTNLKLQRSYGDLGCHVNGCKHVTEFRIDRFD